MDTRGGRAEYLCDEVDEVYIKDLQKLKKDGNIKSDICRTIGCEIG